MRHDIDPHELNDLLDEQHLAVLATHRDDGTVLLSPVWYAWERHRFRVAISSGDVKLRHIALDPPGEDLYGDDVEGAIVTIEPTASRSWDFADDLADVTEKDL